MIYNSSANDLSITRNQIQTNYWYGIWFRPNPANAVGPASVRISENTFELNGLSAIRVETAYSMVIQNNYFEGNEWRTQNSGNEPANQDAEIILTNSSNPNSYTYHVHMIGNYYNLTYPANTYTEHGVVVDNTKGSAPCTYKTTKARYRTSGQVGDITSQKNCWIRYRDESPCYPKADVTYKD